MADELLLPAPCLVVLVGMAGAGKSTWAAAHFRPEQIVSSDTLRAVVGAGEDDITASEDAFALLEQIVEVRLRRRLTTVVDTLGLDADRRARWVALASTNDVATACVVFTATIDECRARNRTRQKSVPQRVLSGQARQVREQRTALDAEGYDVVLSPTVVRTAPEHVVRAAAASPEAETPAAVDAPAALQFGLQIPAYDWSRAEMAASLTGVVQAAEAAGFTSIWVMDHFRQIPMFGPAWHDMLDSYTTLAYIAAMTRGVRVGALVTGITHRSVPHLGKVVATLDVLSGGRAVCGLGVGWFAAENTALGLPFPPVGQRYDLLEDTLQFLPVFWGKGAATFSGRVLEAPEALCYPRPLQDPIPMLVGGNGERRTLRLAAQYADACNLIGEADLVVRKCAVLREHCAAVDRDPSTIEITQLSTTLVGRDADEVHASLERLRPRRTSAEQFATRVNAGTVSDQTARFRGLAAAGVQTAIVSLPELVDTSPIERFAPVIAALTQ